MLSSELWSLSSNRLWRLFQRFQKFAVVGAIGLAVNQAALFVLADSVDLRLSVASPSAIALSMAVTFLLNELWTWHDRGSGRVFSRLVMYAAVNSGGLAINTGVLLFLESQAGMHYLLANLVGAGVAAIWNFGLNHMITWRA
jgi:dolichol-phosphate mannosyltransferase